jgi:lysylphosphatidylglycerol synthetase-like protein (DUF2156 family)
MSAYSPEPKSPLGTEMNPAGVETPPRPNGPAAAAILAAGIGACALGLLTTLAQASRTVARLLTFSDAVGPLSGKTTIAVVIWLVAWALLSALWRGKDVRFERVWTATVILLALGLLGTFPPFYELFSPR